MPYKKPREPINKDVAELLFAIEAAIPFVASRVDGQLCSSSGSPFNLKKLLLRYNWSSERWKWTGLDSQSK